MPEKLYGIRDAANHLKMSVSALKYHIYTAKDLAYQRIGKSLVFTQTQLDEFKQARKRRGRPIVPNPVRRRAYHKSPQD